MHTFNKQKIKVLFCWNSMHFSKTCSFGKNYHINLTNGSFLISSVLNKRNIIFGFFSLNNNSINPRFGNECIYMYDILYVCDKCEETYTVGYHSIQFPDNPLTSMFLEQVRAEILLQIDKIFKQIKYVYAYENRLLCGKCFETITQKKLVPGILI